MPRLSGCSTLFTSLMPTLSSVTYRGLIRAFSWQRAACYSWTQGDSSRENQHRQVAGWKCKSKHWKMLKCLVRVWWSFSVGFSLLYTVIWSNVDIKKKLSVALMISLFGNTLSGALLVFMLCYLLTNACNTILPNHNCPTTLKSFHTKDLCYTINTASV